MDIVFRSHSNRCRNFMRKDESDTNANALQGNDQNAQLETQKLTLIAQPLSHSIHFRYISFSFVPFWMHRQIDILREVHMERCNNSHLPVSLVTSKRASSLSLSHPRSHSASLVNCFSCSFARFLVASFHNQLRFLIFDWHIHSDDTEHNVYAWRPYEKETICKRIVIRYSQSTYAYRERESEMWLWVWYSQLFSFRTALAARTVASKKEMSKQIKCTNLYLSLDKFHLKYADKF